MNGTATAELGDVISCRHHLRQSARSSSLPPVGHDRESPQLKEKDPDPPPGVADVHVAFNAQIVALHIEMKERKSNEQALLRRTEQNESAYASLTGQINSQNQICADYLSRKDQWLQ